MLKVAINKKYYAQKLILEDIKITLNQGDFLSIVGPSGCGKTTILNIISRLDKEYEGSVYFDSCSIGMMFQEARLFPWLSVKDNILLVQKEKNEDEIRRLLKIVGLEESIDEYPKNLSGGMARRVSLVRAFINRPKLILLDEAFISLDYPTSIALKKDFLKFCEDFNPTVVLVTHDLSEAISLSKRVIFLGGTPTKEILNYTNQNNFSKDLISPKIENIKNQILNEYPNILEGKI